jgi:hypothetical protein
MLVDLGRGVAVARRGGRVPPGVRVGAWVAAQVTGWGSAASWLNAVMSWSAQGQLSAMRSRVRRAERVMRAATCSSR